MEKGDSYRKIYIRNYMSARRKGLKYSVKNMVENIFDSIYLEAHRLKEIGLSNVYDEIDNMLRRYISEGHVLAIKEFSGEFKWLSNFEKVDIELGGVIYPSVEHAYQSAKSDDFKWKEICSNKDRAPGKLKRLSKRIRLKDDWENIKIDVMKECVTQKFYQEPFKSLLLATKDRYLEEGNKWKDTFWGVCQKTNIGLNHLGKIIMDIRKELTNCKLEEDFL